MSRSTKPSAFKKFLSVVATASTAIASIFYIQAFAKGDPLVNLRHRNPHESDKQGITLENVHLVQYRGNRKAGEATVDQAFISEDRSQYLLTNVRNGAYLSEDGKRVNFSAPKATWNNVGRSLLADKGVRLWNKDLDLKTELFRLNERQNTLYVPGQIHGRFFKGQIQANNLRYDVKQQEARFGPVAWDGELVANFQDDGTTSRKQWKISSDGGTFKVKNGVRSFDNGTATDGDIIVKADKIVHEEATDIVTATGHVRYFSTKANVACDQAVIYRKDKRAVLTGQVDMLIKPKDKQSKAEVVEIPPFRPVVPKEVAEGRPDAPTTTRDPKESQLDDDLQNAKTLRSYPLAVTASRIEYWYAKGNRHAVIDGSPQAGQELPGGRWRHMWAHQALYDGEKEYLTMLSRDGQSDARAQTSLGDDIIAKKVVVSTKEDDDDLEATGVKATVYGKSDEDNGPGIKPPDPIKPGKSGGGGLKGKIGGGK
jgi:hypothetical protein